MIWVRRIGLAALAGLILLILLDRVFPPPLERGQTVSQLVTDRDGRPLRAFPLDEGRWRFAADLDELDPVFVEALLEVEDKRFWTHGGVDWLGLVRAAGTSMAAGEIVSGGSTITMQTARLSEPRPRTIPSKLIEMIRAHQIEWRLSKREILELYLTLTPYGGNLEGVRAASWRYFGRAPDRLTDDQIALLIALPQAPEARRPDLRPAGAKQGRDIITRKLERLGYFSAERSENVRTADIAVERNPFPSLAWHASARAARGQAGDVASSLDWRLQSALEALVQTKVEALEDEVQIAALIVETRNRKVRAAIGSATRQRPGGWLDLTAQPRSPGSTLKPFIYGLSFDDGTSTPSTQISDLPKRFDSYQPENFDRSFRGDVSISEALQHSLNVPAVLALDRIGADRFAATLASAGAPPRLRRGANQNAGLALALGGAGLTAQELAVLYAALGDGGMAKPLQWREDAPPPATPFRLLSAQSASDILAILADSPAPAGRIPGRLTQNAPTIAFKTGTSYGYRDAWAAAVSGDYTIVVWVGRADGAPRPGITGRSAALPVLFEVVDRLQSIAGFETSAHERVSSGSQAEARGALVSFGGEDSPPEILFPPDEAELWAGDVNGQGARAFVLAGRGEGDLAWYVDGDAVALDDAGLPTWSPERNGFYKVRAVDKDGRTQTVQVRVIGISDEHVAE